MNDLQLWRTLQTPSTLTAAEAVSTLNQLASLPFADRWPYLGWLTPFLRHAHADVRRAALACLDGATGRLALQALVEALNDTDLDVRLAAVETLRSALTHDPWRWVHVLFHPDARVRRAGLAIDRPVPMPSNYWLYLWPDAECVELVRQRLTREPLTPSALPLMLDLIRLDVLTRAEARQWTVSWTWDDWISFLNIWQDYQAFPNLDAALTHPDWPLHGDKNVSRDRLDDVLELFWNDDPQGAADAPTQRFFHLLLEHLFDPKEPTFRHWLLYSTLVMAAERGSLPVEAAAVAAACDHRFLLTSWVPLDVRTGAIRRLHLARQLHPAPPEAIRPLVESDLCRRADGRIDLRLLGGVLRYLKTCPQSLVVEWIGETALIEAMREDFEAAADFFRISADSLKGRKQFLRKLCNGMGADRPRMLALLAYSVPADDLSFFLTSLDAPSAQQLFTELHQSVPSSGKPLNTRKLRVLADILVRPLRGATAQAFFDVWLIQPNPEQSPLGLKLLARLVEQLDWPCLQRAIKAFSPDRLHKFLIALMHCDGFPYDKELALAQVLADHPDAVVRDWCWPRLSSRSTTSVTRWPSVRDEGPALRLGLCAALAVAAEQSLEHRLDCCANLLASHDPLSEVDAQFQRFALIESDFVQTLDVVMVEAWRGEARLPLLGHAWLWRWDEHRNHLQRLITAMPGGLADFLTLVQPLSPLLRQRCWQAALALIQQERWHSPSVLANTIRSAEIALLIEHLKTDVAVEAARLLMLTRDHGPIAPEDESRVICLLPTLSEAVRSILQPWLDSRGLPTIAPKPVPVEPPTVEVADVRCAVDLDQLAEWTAAANSEIALVAAQRLTERDEPGRLRLLAVFRQRSALPCVSSITAQVLTWPDGEALRGARELIRDSSVDPETRYYVALALVERDELDGLSQALQALAEPCERFWAEHWHLSMLIHHGLTALRAARQLVTSPNPILYTWAVEHLLDHAAEDATVQQALLAFLEIGTDRFALRQRVAEKMLSLGQHHALLPLLLPLQKPEESFQALLVRQPFSVLQAVVQAVLWSGLGAETEAWLESLLSHPGIAHCDRSDAFSLLLMHSDNATIRNSVRAKVQPTLHKSRILRRVAETFAWGVRIGRQLTGKLFAIQMIAGEKLGYTRFTENKLYITPLPILRGHPEGREVVQALILHELGHHLYHRGPAEQAVWEESDRDGLQRVLNLVADEHLERNLRSIDESFGNQLKTLASYAFMRTAKEYAVESLLTAIRGRSFEVLSTTTLGFARQPGCVRVEQGHVLQGMERAGVSFARFMRALRMGLGDRHDDAKVRQGLALFKGRFRQSTMPRLLEIARELKAIFGDEIRLLDSFDPEDALLGSGDESDAEAEGLTDAEVQGELRRHLEGRASGRPLDRPHGRGGKGLNLGPDEAFDPIENVQPMPYSPSEHARYAQQVARPARTLRRFLEHLGLALVPSRYRTRGKSFDRSRTQALVLRGDPRVLITREIRTNTDLFLGVVVDCSGSMSHAGNIEKAKLFGTLLAEAAKGLKGVDVRLFGFTDSVIYDAGSAHRCAIHALEANGGNNDAAGLWHAAQVARQSRRRAKLLTMISDGSPTECTVTALRALVERLTRQYQMCCAQVAVCELEHRCFANHILLDEADPDESARQFGRVMARLVHKALAGG